MSKGVLFVVQDQQSCLTEEERSNYTNEIKSLQDELKQVQQLAEVYKEQVIKLENQIAKKIEQNEGDKELFKNREEKLNQRLKLLGEKYKDLEKRRIMEIQGFKNELNQLRDKLRNVEKRFFKLSQEREFESLNFKCNDDILLKNFHESATKSKEIQGELTKLKSKLYSIEEDFKRL